jgi:hypothetical protein
MTPIYHITHIDNLPKIIAAGGLWCDVERVKQQFECVGIAHQHIKERRAKRVVPRAAGGTLAQYVPFYFAPRSPMLYTIHCGNVAGYAGGQREVLHLVSSMEQAVQLGQPWTFTDGHAEMEFSTFYDDLAHLNEVNWEVMKSVYWNDTPSLPDRKRQRQAEFLVHRSFPWHAFHEIGVYDRTTAARVAEVVKESKHAPAVSVRLIWYYPDR